MEFLDIANRYIPGYRLLTPKERRVFQRSVAGQNLVRAVNTTLFSIERTRSSLSLLQIFFVAGEINYAEARKEYHQLKEQLLSDINQTVDYKEIVGKIIWRILLAEYPDFKWLTAEQKKTLAEAEFSKVLQTEIPPLYDEAMDAIQNSLNHNILEKNQAKRKRIISDWEAIFLADPEMAPHRASIARQKERIRQKEIAQKLITLDERAHALAQAFPLLNNPLPSNTESAIADLKARYRVEMQKKEPNTAEIEEMLLTEVVFHYLQQASAKNLPKMVLHNFNLKQANRIAQKVRKAFGRGDEGLAIGHWLQKYKEALTEHVIEKLLLINGKKWDVPEKTQGQELLTSLSYLWNNPLSEHATTFVNKLADAHAFIQATSFATQNESSFLAVLDLYNYSRFANQINENKAIIASLLSPFRPIYEEYRNIGLYEKDVFFKLVRMVMPMVVAVAVVVVVAVILGPLAIPDLAFTLALIPTLMVALGAAAKYVTVKNDIYLGVRQRYWGGPFKIPEFQINATMIAAFGSPENATAVRNFYIKELKRCEEREVIYQSKEALSQQDLATRNENSSRVRTLWLEWYDIHSNEKLGFDELPQIVLARLQEVGSAEFQNLQNALENGEAEQINSFVDQLVSEVTTKLNSAPQVSPVGDTAEHREVGALPVTQGRINHTPRLFRPLHCLDHQRRVEEVDSIARSLRTPRAGS